MLKGALASRENEADDLVISKDELVDTVDILGRTIDRLEIRCCARSFAQSSFSPRVLRTAAKDASLSSDDKKKPFALARQRAVGEDGLNSANYKTCIHALDRLGGLKEEAEEQLRALRKTATVTQDSTKGNK